MSNEITAPITIVRNVINAPISFGVTGKSAYRSYLDTTDDDPVLTEAEWSTGGGGGGAPSEHAANHAAGGTDPICYHSDTAPTTAEPGQKWLQTSTGREYEYFGGAWVEVASGPALDLSGYLTTEYAESRGARNAAIALGTDETGNENTVTLKTSPTLTIPLEVGTWAIEALIVINAGASFAAAGSRQKLHFDGTGAFTGAYYSIDNGAASGAGWPTTRQTEAVNYEHLASGASTSTLRIGTLTVTAPGNLVVQYAQRTATAAASPTLAVPSYIRANKL